uniref:Uncharacterized protein n=1 Tax=Avena sativa TaxID=4498 RepID=A0ACD5XYC4_AVESA
MEVLRDFAQSEPLNRPTRPSTLAFESAAAASTRRILLSGLSHSNPLPPLTVRLLHGRLLRLDLIADLSHLLLRALSFSGLHLHALSLHSLFPDPSHLTLPFALNSASRLPNPLRIGEQLHARSVKLPSHSTPRVLTSLINFYAGCDLLNHARWVFDEIHCPSKVAWTALIGAYMNTGRDKEAVATARDAFASGMRPDSFTVVQVLTACSRVADLDTGEAVQRAAQREGIAGDLFVATAAADLYLKCGEMAKAREVFDKMPEKDAVAWGAMIRGYISNGHHRGALELFFAMQTQGVRPNCNTVADALSACTRLGALDLGRQAAGVVDWDEFLDDPVLGTALIDMYVKCGSTWDAWFVFQQMRKRDIILWDTMILGLAMTGHGKTAFALVGQMEKSGMELNAHTFIGRLCSCTHTGLAKDRQRYFRNMIQSYHIIPRIEHYGFMVDLLGHAGLLQEAHQLINDMPMQANVVMWRALLGGCKIHRDAELAELVLKQLILLEPLNSENYVMLSNIYSNSNRCEDAAKLRLDMKAKGVKDVPCPIRGWRTTWPLLQGVLARADKEQVRAAGQKPVLRTDVRWGRSGLRQVVSVCAEAGGVENCYIFKNRLHEYTQKAGLMTPEYQTLKEGPSREPIFKSTVVINNAKYESLPGFFSRNDAEQSAAEVALKEISKSVPLPTNARIPAVQATGLCKKLLEKYARKMNYTIPSYNCNRQAKGVGPIICTVEIGGVQYIGAAVRTKKEAEMEAARTALLAIQGKSEGCANGTTKYIVVPGKRQGKAKKGGFKQQRNKMKFIKDSGEAVNVEKDEAIVPGDTHHSDVPMEQPVRHGV